jgi:hypothetical protein
VAADAEGFIDLDTAVILSPEDGLCGAGRNAGCIPAVLTCQGDKGYFGIRVMSLFQFRDMSEGNPVISGEIVLVHAGHHTGHASAATGNIKGETILAHGFYPLFFPSPFLLKGEGKNYLTFFT